MRQPIQTSDAPAAIGPYSQAIQCAGSLLFTAGQIPLDPKTGNIVGGDAAEQVDQVMKNLGAILAAAGTDFSRVVKTTIFLKSMSDFAAVNEVYARYLQAPYPSRSTVAVAGLPRDVLVEIECVALLP